MVATLFIRRFIVDIYFVPTNSMYPTIVNNYVVVWKYDNWNFWNRSCLSRDELLEDWVPFIHTLTSDNGKEFAQHEIVAEKSNIDFYFALPYHPWERGANENLNGLIRQYLPKGCDFQTIDNQRINEIETKLNQRPRKRFKFETPMEIMERLLFNKKVAFCT